MDCLFLQCTKLFHLERNTHTGAWLATLLNGVNHYPELRVIIPGNHVADTGLLNTPFIDDTAYVMPGTSLLFQLRNSELRVIRSIPIVIV